jgi:bisphosphoglycerate-independent phosphoglycerate mutase (AlkP superfamily)
VTSARCCVNGPTLYDVAPTALKLLNQEIPPDMRGKALV